MMIAQKFFYDVLEVCRRNEPKVIVIENVAHLLKHDKGNPFQYIKQCLGVYGYRIYYKVLDSQDFGVSQRRKRAFIVGFHRKYFSNKPFVFPKGETLNKALRDILDEDVEEKYFLTEKMKQYELDIASNNGI